MFVTTPTKRKKKEEEKWREVKRMKEKKNEPTDREKA